MFVALLVSCSNKQVYEQIHTLPANGWEIDGILHFDMPVTDTTRAYDLLLHLRNKGNYEYSNIWLFIETKSPAGNSLRDTFEIRLTDDSGRWLGKGIGDINEMLVPYKQNVLFPYRGIYAITIQQAMREETLENFLDVGVRLQYHKQ